MRKNVDPSSNRRDTKNNQPFVFDSFSRGTIKDPPASEIQDCLADSKNLSIFPGFYEGRTGCRLFTSTRFPSIEDRIGYSAHKDGNQIVSDSGDIFSQGDVGNYWCWGETYELITGYVNATTVETESSTYYAGVDCSVMGAPNALFWHKSLKMWVLQLGQEVYTAEWNIPEWNRVFPISRDLPANSKSDEAEYTDFGFLFNGNGLYKLELDVNFPIAYRANLDPPNIKLNPVPTFTGATCKYRYLYSAQRLEREGIIVDRQTPSRIALETGSNIPDDTDIDYAEIYTENEIGPAHPNLVSELWVPVVPNTNPQEYQWHLTHFPIWRTYDLEAKDPNDVNKEKFNDPQRYVWVKDLRMGAAFWVYILGDRVLANWGEFEEADTFSILELDTGERYEIIEYISATEVRIDKDTYYNVAPVLQGPYAAAIGNGRVIGGIVVGDILERTTGGTFTAADVRKTVFSSLGYRLYITEYLDANRVRIHLDDIAPILQGFTIDPTHRKFYDTMTDEQLRAREDFYSCYARYRQALPSCNLGKIMPGFVVMAYRGRKEIYYTHLQSKMDYLIGQYVPTQVSEEVQDAIHGFWLFQDILSIFCATSTWGAQVGLSEFTTLPGSNEAIALLPGVKVIDRHIGCLDIGSVKEVENGVVQLMTNEPGGEALRQFNGTQYSQDNLLVDPSLGGRIQRAIEKTKRMSAAIYDGFLGYILWRKNR